MPEDLVINGKTIPSWIVEILEARISAMPANIKLAVLSEVFTKDDIIREVTNRTAFGMEILKMEAEYFYDLVRDA